MIKLQNVRSGFGARAAFIAAVDDICLTIHDNEILGIAGESGCGKSTLIRTLYGDFTGGLKLMSGTIIVGTFGTGRRDGSKSCRRPISASFGGSLCPTCLKAR